MKRRWGLQAAALAAALGVWLGAVWVDASMKPLRIAGGRFEASGVVHLKGAGGVLFVDDDRTREVFWMEVGADGVQKGPAVGVPLGADVVDPEGITTDGTYVYVVGSQSKGSGFDGDGLVRFRFDVSRRAVSDVSSIRGLKAYLAANVRELAGTARLRGDHVLNIEAVAWDPDAERLLLGLRAPVPAGEALVIPLKLRDRSGPFTAANLEVEGGLAIRVPLEGAGVRSLEYDDRVRGFRIISGAGLDAETRDFRVLEWGGPAAPDRVREITRFPRNLKPEGITRAELYGRSVSVVVFDTGGFLLLD
jgi:hypothetical protein